MAKNRIKAKSKRVTCHKRYKILRKVREHHRKVRKEAKKNINQHKRKDPGIPNSFPFKEEVFKHVEEFKKQTNEVRKYNLIHGNKPTDAVKVTNAPVSPALHREADKVIIEADVILEVLDARDPLGTRCMETEQKVLAAKKRLVLILNKIDLIPKANLQSWLCYLRQFFPVLPFKANTQQQNKHLSRGKWIENVNEDISVKGKKFTKAFGVDDLLSLLANYSRNGSQKATSEKNSAGCLTVGVIGLPNTGKSAIINTLKRQKVCASGNVPGMTRQCQRIRIDKDLFLIDSPGIVVSKSTDPSELVLRNCIRPEQLPDPVPAVEAILSRCPKQQLMSKYDIDDYSNTTEFLVHLAHRLGRLKKGGVPNTTMAARSLINDWITGKIVYFTELPGVTEGLPTVSPDDQQIASDEDIPSDSDQSMDE
ncbi:putative guanine nucleotide-binding protein 3 [Fasciola hepatica]|uniref:Guanine nucleotide-binding protein 3 n=1 Tax=Fasciola hepatica TaxID=6192 RepID=A0A4E0R070_FASHE|nr:putative guanine nucleotide-binding protein 3 [Fasciola hepatica]